MPYGIVLKDERRTSNIERPTSNEKRISNTDSAVVAKATMAKSAHSTPISVSSSFPIQHSMLDVRCSMFIFFSKPSTVHPVQKQLSGYVPAPCLLLTTPCLPPPACLLPVSYAGHGFPFDRSSPPGWLIFHCPGPSGSNSETPAWS